MKTLLKRITAKTPIFFKKIQRIAVFMIALGTYLNNPIGLPDGFVVPPNLANIGAYMIFVGGAIAAVSQLTEKTE